MKVKTINVAAFAEALKDVQGWEDIDGLYRACRAKHVFGASFARKAFEHAAKEKIRKLIKRNQLKTSQGEEIRFQSLVIKEGEKLTPRRVYKQEMLFDVGDSIQQITYWQDRKRYCQSRIDYNVALAKRLHGDQVETMLPFGD